MPSPTRQAAAQLSATWDGPGPMTCLTPSPPAQVRRLVLPDVSPDLRWSGTVTDSPRAALAASTEACSAVIRSTEGAGSAGVGVAATSCPLLLASTTASSASRYPS